MNHAPLQLWYYHSMCNAESRIFLEAQLRRASWHLCTCVAHGVKFAMTSSLPRQSEKADSGRDERYEDTWLLVFESFSTPSWRAWSTIRRESIPPVVRFQGTSVSFAGPCDAFQCVMHSGGRKNKRLPPFVFWVRSGPGVAIDKLRPNSVKGNFPLQTCGPRFGTQ